MRVIHLEKTNVLISGPAGCGKTELAVSGAYRLLQEGCDVVYAARSEDEARLIVMKLPRARLREAASEVAWGFRTSERGGAGLVLYPGEQPGADAMQAALDIWSRLVVERDHDGTKTPPVHTIVECASAGQGGTALAVFDRYDPSLLLRGMRRGVTLAVVAQNPGAVPLPFRSRMDHIRAAADSPGWHRWIVEHVSLPAREYALLSGSASTTDRTETGA